MRRYLLIAFVFMAVLALSGCTGEKAETTTVSTEDGTSKVTTTVSGDTQTVTVEETTEEGTQTTTITGSAGANPDSWCPEGGNWEMRTAGPQGMAGATMKVVKLETSGKYAGLCHVVSTTTGPEGEQSIDMWFDESGEHGYMEMEVGGQKIVQSF